MLNQFLQGIKNKSIHVIGITGSEGSSILKLLLKHGCKNITGHDFSSKALIEKNYKLWHKGITVEERNEHFHLFLKDLEKIKFFQGKNYLKGISQADIIFIPQSWRLYKHNYKLYQARKNNIPFYSLTRLYLDYSSAKIIGVTGTVGKGSVSNILVELLKKTGKKVFLAGNDTWMMQKADILEEMRESDYLVLEISHRQLLDGFSRAPEIVIFTNIYPNHLDEMSWREYKETKFSILIKQTKEDISILNFDCPELKFIGDKLKSHVLYYSSKDLHRNTKDVQQIYKYYMNINTSQYIDNIIAASTAASVIGIKTETILTTIKNIQNLPARLDPIGVIQNINFYDDLKSTTPWATLKALEKLGKNTILICGGRTKGIDYKNFATAIQNNSLHIVILKSEMSDKLLKLLPSHFVTIVDALDLALNTAFHMSKKNFNIIVSPGAGFFYRDFIKGKSSIRKIFTSLLQEGQS